MSKVTGKVVWVTGASSGIGEALVYELAKKGAKLIISSRRKEELERVKGNCVQQAQPNIRVLPLDLSQPTTLALCAEAAIQLFGQVDILVNNGGVSQRSLAKETTVEVDRKVMEVDYFGTIALTKALIPHFINRKSGHFVTISSVLGLIGTPYRSGYAAAKHALHGFFDSLRAELWNDSKNIHVTLICPGWIRTNVTINALKGDGSKLNHMDPTTDHGMLPEVFAKKMIREVEANTEQVFIGGMKERVAIYMMQYFPRVFSKIVRSATVR
jgi:short-subunit dehydrogenase